MATFNIYQQPAAHAPLARKWFFRALIASLVIHAGLFAALSGTKVRTLMPATERLVPRNFSLTRVAVNENTLNDDEDKKPDTKQESTAPAPIPSVQIPKETPTVDTNPQDVVYSPTAPPAIKPIATENPKVSDSDLKNLAKMQQSVTKEIDNDLTKVSEQLINDKQTSSKSTLKFSDSSKTGVPGNPAGSDSAIPGTKSLDEALSSTGGGLQSGDKIGIRGGALFEFDSADLRPEAMTKIRELADTLKDVEKHHPAATFLIDGYADSIGANTNPQYNKDLSQKRADAVKGLLVASGMDATKIQAVGNGSTNFIDPPTYDPAKQAQEANNRRVTIEITFPH